MPTSSQALILINTDNVTIPEFSKLKLNTENKLYPVSRINFHGEQLSVLYSSRDLRSDSASPQKELLPEATDKGCRGVFAFDPFTRDFSWQLLSDINSGKLDQLPKHRVLPQVEKCKSKKSVSYMEPNTEDEIPLGRVPDPVAFEQSIRKLVNLGFRSESSKTLDESSEIFSPRRQSPSSLKTPCLKRSSPEKNLIQESRLLQLRHPSAPAVNQHPEIFQTTITRLPRRMDSFVLNYKSASTPSIAKIEERALFEEVKRRVAKRKKKKYIPTIRMRRELPPPNPNVLCFNFYNGDFSHRDVKNMIESQSETKILNLKFDPIYVHMGGSCSQYKSMWVFTINNIPARANLLYYGLRFKDENIKVRLYDDVMREEHSAYKLYKEVENEQLKTQPPSDQVDKPTKLVSITPTPIPAGLLTASFVSSPENPKPEMKVKKSKTPKSHRDKQISFYVH